MGRHIQTEPRSNCRPWSVRDLARGGETEAPSILWVWAGPEKRAHQGTLGLSLGSVLNELR